MQKHISPNTNMNLSIATQTKKRKIAQEGVRND